MAVILVRALGFGTKAGGAGSEVVHVEEAEAIGNLIVGHVADMGVDAHRGLTSLVAVHAQVVVRIFGRDNQAAGELTSSTS